MYKILVIDDDQALQDLLIKCMSKLYEVDAAWNGKQGLSKMSAEKYDIVLLDVMLPGEDGFVILKRIRELYAVPVIMLTARDSQIDKISGLETGADDYVTKPFDIEELLARITSQIRRNTVWKDGIPSQERLVFGNLSIDPEYKAVIKGEEEILLTGKEFDVLYYLASNPGHVYTKKQIYKAAWKDEYIYDDDNIMAVISKIRKKIEDNPASPERIQTIRGVGYRFSGE